MHIACNIKYDDARQFITIYELDITKQIPIKIEETKRKKGTTQTITVYKKRTQDDNISTQSFNGWLNPIDYENKL